MSYTALYRKFRPGHFDEVKGQEPIVTTLKNQILANRIGHAYLFCGTRGTGKTSIAKLFGKAVNCENPIEGSPCGICRSCKNIAAGVSMNLIEIDAASNTGVDNIRTIIEEVSYSPQEGKYKVYIIDEVHMLSKGAFNALLKTLEEPPSYVIFILATTEVHKLPITILSRCQRYDFKRISIRIIADRLRELTKKEEIQAEERALTFIAGKADGSMRDALSLLDQCIAFHLGEELTYDKVLKVLGAMDAEIFNRLLQLIIKRDVAGCIRMVDEINMQGVEMTVFAEDFTWYLRNLLLVKTSDNIEDVINISSDNLKILKENAKFLEMETILRYIRILAELTNNMRYAVAKRILLEISLIKLCNPAMEKKQDALLDRIRVLEEKVEKGEFLPVSGGQPREEVKAPIPLPKALPEDIRQVLEQWRVIIDSLSAGLKAVIKNVKLSLGEGNRLLIVTQDDVHADYLTNPVHQEEIKKAISEHIGKEVELEVRVLKEGTAFETSYADIFKCINMEIEIED